MDDTRWWQGHHHPTGGLTEIVVAERGPWQAVCDNSGYEGRVTCIRMGVIRMGVIRMGFVEGVLTVGVPGRFCIPNGVLVEFLDEEEVVSTEKAEGRAITFSKEQFNAGLQFPLPVLFKEFLHFTQIPPAFIHPNIVRVLMGCSILTCCSTLTSRCWSCRIQRKEGRRDMWWSGVPGRAIGASGEAFSPNYSLVLRVRTEGHVVEWVEKASFRLNKLFEITALERQYDAAHCAEPDGCCPGVPRCNRRTLRNAERSLTIGRGEKRGNLAEGSGEKTVRSSPPAGAPAKKKKKTSNKGKEVEIPLLQRSSPHPDADAAEASCAAYRLLWQPNGGNGGRKPGSAILRAKPSCPCTGEGASLKETSSARNLKSGSSGGFKIDSRRPSKSVAHPSRMTIRRSETEMATETPAVPMVVPDEALLAMRVGREAEADSTRLDHAMPSAKMFEVVETLVSGLRGMVNNTIYLLTCCGPLIT
ncbi:hypothetical protein CK203_100622 [Vitis vinifera]|uniref:Uncharacterized protein n=1 Tax=Vitis vinifera TaxID=29760 RepID=A0A438FIK3_VITVI|nr:hypothetical protein CK203_100622 [Vitis vinifera]